MKNLQRKACSLLCILALLISLVPVSAWAGDEITAAGSTTITKKMSFQQLWRIRISQKYILQAT